MDSSDRSHGARPPALGFTSDNIAGASPEVIEALAASSAGQASPYGADDLTARVELKLSEIFEREVDVFLVPTGTAANALCLSAMTPPWGNIYCHPASHINNDECGAPASYTNGAKLVAVDGQSAKMDSASLRSAARVKVGDVHSTQPSCASITQATEEGRAACTHWPRSKRWGTSARHPPSSFIWTAHDSPMRWCPSAVRLQR
jgi:threonine aldolase